MPKACSSLSIRKIKKFASLAPSQRRDLTRAVHALWVARCKLAFSPVGKILDRIERRRAHDGTTDTHEAERIAWALAAASLLAPWRSDCLVQAIAAMTWAGQIGLRAEMHLGIRKTGRSRIEAHAWVTSGDRALCGALPDLSSFEELEQANIPDGSSFRTAS